MSVNQVLPEAETFWFAEVIPVAMSLIGHRDPVFPLSINGACDCPVLVDKRLSK